MPDANGCIRHPDDARPGGSAETSPVSGGPDTGGRVRGHDVARQGAQPVLERGVLVRPRGVHGGLAGGLEEEPLESPRLRCRPVRGPHAHDRLPRQALEPRLVQRMQRTQLGELRLPALRLLREHRDARLALAGDLDPRGVRAGQQIERRRGVGVRSGAGRRDARQPEVGALLDRAGEPGDLVGVRDELEHLLRGLLGQVGRRGRGDERDGDHAGDDVGEARRGVLLPLVDPRVDGGGQMVAVARSADQCRGAEFVEFPPEQRSVEGLGAVWVVGNWISLSDNIIFFNDQLNVPTLNVVLVRQSWQEIAPNSAAWP